MNIQYERPWVYPAQEAAIFCPERYGIVEASTKSGKTAGCMIWLTEQAMQQRAGRNVWWVAPIRSQAAIVFERLKRAIPRPLYTKNDSKPTITLVNGVVMWFKSGDDPDGLYGDDVYAVVIDEASRCKDEVWHAVRSTLTATGGPARIIGNVKGRKNWAYQLARKAEAGEPGMHYAKITAVDAVAAGVLNLEEIEDAKRLLPEAVYRELYEAEPSDDQGNPFGMKAIRACVVPELSTKPVVAWGWDLAKSTDWCVGVGLDQHGHMAAFERWQQPWAETMQQIGELTQAPALVDATGVGDPIVEQLQRAYGSYLEGFKFNPKSKQQLMEGLAVAIQQRQVRFPDGVLVNELEAFEYVYTRTGVKYSAPSGLHDDAVMALALAVRRLIGAGNGLGFLQFANEQVTGAAVAMTLTIGKHDECLREGGKVSVDVRGRCKRCGTHLHAPQASENDDDDNPWLKD